MKTQISAVESEEVAKKVVKGLKERFSGFDFDTTWDPGFCVHQIWCDTKGASESYWIHRVAYFADGFAHALIGKR